MLLGFIGVAMVIRLHGLSSANLWLDEANSWQVASGSWSGVLAELRGSPVGPLYFVLLKLWISALGDSAFALRAFSVAASLVLIPVTYAIGARLLSRPAGLLAAALVALSPLELYFAQEARMYMLTSLLAALCLWAYVSWRGSMILELQPGSPGRVAAPIGYTVAAIAMLFTNPVAGPLLVAINLDALVIWWRVRDREGVTPSMRRRATVRWISAQVAVVVALIVYLAWLRLDSAAASQAWRAPRGVEGALRDAMLVPFNAISGQHYYPSDFWLSLGALTRSRAAIERFLTTLVVEPLTLIVFVVAGDAAIRERWSNRVAAHAAPESTGSGTLLLFALLVPLLVCVVISTSKGVEAARYFFYVVPFFLLLLADGLLVLTRRARRASLAVLVLALLFGTCTTKAAISRDSDYRTTAALITQEGRAGDRIMIQPREMGQPLHYYLRARDTKIIGLAADASAGQALAALPPGRTWVVIDYRSRLYPLAPSELATALGSPLERDAYVSDASAGVRVALVDTQDMGK